MWASGWVTEGNAAYCTVVHEQPSAPVSVQEPTSLKVLNLTVLPNGQGLNFGCSESTANYGIMVDIEYQVLDQNGVPIASANMMPHEKGTLFSGMPYHRYRSNWFQNSTKNTADGTFHDVPFGVCANGTFSVLPTSTQNITMIMPDGLTPAVRSQTFTATEWTVGTVILKRASVVRDGPRSPTEVNVRLTLAIFLTLIPRVSPMVNPG